MNEKLFSLYSYSKFLISGTQWRPCKIFILPVYKKSINNVRSIDRSIHVWRRPHWLKTKTNYRNYYWKFIPSLRTTISISNHISSRKHMPGHFPRIWFFYNFKNGIWIKMEFHSPKLIIISLWTKYVLKYSRNVFLYKVII